MNQKTCRSRKKPQVKIVLTIEKFEITKTRLTKMLFRRINMPHVFIEVTKLKARCENYKNTITNFHITICDSFKKSTLKSQAF